MNVNEEIKQVEQAMSTIMTFFQNHFSNMNPKVFSKWSDVRTGIVEELYYMRKSSEREEKQS